jgi:hypothetical protein
MTILSQSSSSASSKQTLGTQNCNVKLIYLLHMPTTAQVSNVQQQQTAEQQKHSVSHLREDASYAPPGRAKHLIGEHKGAKSLTSNTNAW